MLSRVWSGAVVGIEGVKVGVEVDVAGGLPKTIIVGLPDTAVQESRERVKAAIRNSGFAFPVRQITVNLSPADLRKEGPIFDLPIALGILAASQQVESTHLSDYLFLGEVSLDGSLRGVAGVLPMAVMAARLGFRGIVVPKDNVQEAAVVEVLKVYGFNHLLEVTQFLQNPSQFPVATPRVEQEDMDTNYDLADVKGQYSARRALEIAAAGGHNLLLVGPPGAGKTMLARRLPSILPPLSFAEALEVSQIYSVAGLLKGRSGLITQRPFRSPHHSASGVALVGGGSLPKPGEISLSHHGVLFLDELTEFKRSVLEFLRQPLEDGFVTVSRARQTVSFPARFTLIASTNPCPCGYYGDSLKECTCFPRQRQQYWAKLSGPLLDRIDLQVVVNRLKPEEMLQQKAREGSHSVRERVIAARERARIRFQDYHISCNAQMQSHHLRQFCPLDDHCRGILDGAIRKLGLSARAFDRILKVARTIADLDSSPSLQPHHLAEAIQYRTLDRLL
ncbi:MAG: YifB family Mg chelatase-like AAA ATPase [Geminocystis sp.]|nr:YifB family Mg chelatase-like AAA ATPase [Geminocystis sp.]HIK38347.1 YifB family Mg chelatase-like AAA ATPase [Geminocystis sp. M7585_C2015_104]MCS7148748.1 YifB family Mg chelatase-like AAA ATPase [Geminocystis sp.]MCX8078378.1 YifB family Mg chelatase-like AAA ATPase [Geminocystis sp.]MDW8116103.1 YifB family Mg chelatase-like AAA ATPase [Geminocystis sp.]